MNPSGPKPLPYGRGSESPSFNPLEHPICLRPPLRLVLTSTWTEHTPFAMFLIDLLRPGLFVELGTFYGASYCAFCQAVKELGLTTRCFAVDTWQGDWQGGYFGTAVLDDVRAHHDPLYASFSELLPCTFNEAAGRFEEGTIDLVHVDGCHTYEAVAHDFQTWLPKMSRRGVMLFHDTQVRKGDFGVYRFWDEVKGGYPHFEFEHGHGLGVLAVGVETPPALAVLTRASSEETARLRAFFARLGWTLTCQLEAEKLRFQYEEMQRSRTWAIAQDLHRWYARLVPAGSSRDRLLRRVLGASGPVAAGS